MVFIAILIPLGVVHKQTLQDYWSSHPVQSPTFAPRQRPTAVTINTDRAQWISNASWSLLPCNSLSKAESLQILVPMGLLFLPSRIQTHRQALDGALHWWGRKDSVQSLQGLLCKSSTEWRQPCATEKSAKNHNIQLENVQAPLCVVPCIDICHTVQGFGQNCHFVILDLFSNVLMHVACFYNFSFYKSSLKVFLNALCN